MALAAARAVVDETIKRPQKPEGPVHLLVQPGLWTVSKFPAHTLLRHALYTVLGRTGGIGDVLAACATAAKLLARRTPMFLTFPPWAPTNLLSPLHTHPSRPTEIRRPRPPPPPSVFLTLWPWPAARVLPPHYPLFKHSAVPQA